MAAQSLLQQVGVYAQGVVKGLATISVLQLLLILIGSVSDHHAWARDNEN